MSSYRDKRAAAPLELLCLAFAGLVAGLVLSVLADRSVWLEMRVNTGLLLPIAVIAAVFAGTFAKQRVPAWIVLLLEATLVLLLLWAYRFAPGALLTVPASSFREGFFLPDWSTRSLDAVLGAIFLLGNGMLLISRELSTRWPRRRPPADRR